ncbi:hypothetical protein DIS18_00030 [Algibacter marinivivus]|uniref:Lipocalin-like domain-containing protein n=1 Tax=Algibacter marinivivus TaxID=2100723 RepID=A0A2U2X5F8_9FLAO|nr:hypothetical protein [Algibacter marinivivus]PWH82984.1 hypothetical protein DIS18_00030 [Algibacter marinivivus]
MKTKLVILFFSIFLFTNCLPDDNNDITNQETTVIQWHLVNVSGGISGDNHSFEIDDVIWIFDEFNSRLIIQNNNDDDVLEDGLNSGNYDYFFINDNDDNLFLVIDIDEYGLITFSQDGEILTIDRTNQSTGNVADEYIYEFDKQTIVIN